MDITILIPLTNEADSLVELSDSIARIINDLNKTFEIIFVDDGSTDNSLEVLLAQKKKISEIKIVSFQRNYGKSAALNTGFKMSKGDIVITMDADLQDDPEEIPFLIDKVSEGFDLVSGWKTDRKDPFIKNFTSKIFNWVTSKVSGVNLHDHNCGIKAYKQEVLEHICIYGELHRYIPVFAHAAGYKVGELPVKHRKRQHGKTKYGVWRFIAGYLDLVTVVYLTRFKNRPMHLFGFIGSFPFGLGVIMNLYIVYQKYVYQIGLSTRPLLLLGVLLILIGVQIFGIGLIGDMLASRGSKDIKYNIKKVYE